MMYKTCLPLPDIRSHERKKGEKPPNIHGLIKCNVRRAHPALRDEITSDPIILEDGRIMSKRIFTIFVDTGISQHVAACGGTPSSGSVTIKIATQSPLSGGMAAVGGDIKMAPILAYRN